MKNASDHGVVEWNDYDGTFPITMKHGFDLYLQPGCEYSRKRFLYRIAESNEIDYLTKIWKSGGGLVCLDIGANIGYWSKFLLSVIKVKTLHCIEPYLQTFKILSKNLRKFNNVQVSRLAISDHDGNLDLFIDPNHTGDNRPQQCEGREAIQVPCLTLDSYVENRKIEKVHFIKLDIQGGEIHALRGAPNTISRYRPLIMIEVAPELSPDINSFLAQFIEQNRYQAFSIAANEKNTLSMHELNEYEGNLFLSPL